MGATSESETARPSETPDFLGNSCCSSLGCFVLCFWRLFFVFFSSLIYGFWLPLVLFFDLRLLVTPCSLLWFTLLVTPCSLLWFTASGYPLFSFLIYGFWLPLVLFFDLRLLVTSCSLFWFTASGYPLFSSLIYGFWLPLILFFDLRLLVTPCSLLWFTASSYPVFSSKLSFTIITVWMKAVLLWISRYSHTSTLRSITCVCIKVGHIEHRLDVVEHYYW